MPEPRREESDDPEASADEALSGDALDLDGLRARGDVSGLLALARAYRSGGAPGGRDMARCFEAYRVAAELGSADAEYAVALFCMTGGVVAQDLKEGAARLRAAADKGSVPAKVYVGNLYELGIHYKADPEKADVWYRNAARGAGIDASPGSAEYAEALAELGCARYVLALVESGAVDGDDRARLLQRARAHGYGLRMKDANAGDRPTFLDSLQRADESLQRADEDASPASAHDPGRPERQRATTTPDTKAARAAAGAQAGRGDAKGAGPSQASIGLAAFGYALLFAVAGVGAGYAATLGARELVARGAELPVLGARTELVFPIVLGLVGVLPAWLVYRLGAVLKALVVGAFFGAIGWVAWGTGQATLHALRPVQAIAFGLAGFLAALLALGLTGGTKQRPARRARERPPLG
ncbi:MAG: sel1 repeat family protein [Labilithrix sp.]|nr:sel1 repeat family protein [Labilithrix sp.]